MKVCRKFLPGIFTACFLVAVPTFASGGSQSDVDAEHAGYQGIPVRGSSDRGAAQQADSADTQRYPTLPRRQNETNINAASVADRQNSNQNDQDGGGYRGIPRSSSNQDDTPRNENPNPRELDRAGYSGIPQSVTSDQGETQLAVRRASALISPK